MRARCDAPDAATLKGIRDRALLHTLASSGMRASATATLTSPQITETDQGMGVWVQDKNDMDPGSAYSVVKPGTGSSSGASPAPRSPRS